MPGYGGSSAISSSSYKETENFGMESTNLSLSNDTKINVAFYLSIVTLLVVSYPHLKKLL